MLEKIEELNRLVNLEYGRITNLKKEIIRLKKELASEKSLNNKLKYELELLRKGDAK